MKTKIIATIGPATESRPILEKLVDAGMDVARLNCSHGSHETHADVIHNIRAISRKTNRSIGILLDLRGPKIRTGNLKNGKPVRLIRNRKFRITTKSVTGTADMVSTTYRRLPDDVKTDDTILIDDGLIRLKVLETSNDTILTRVVNGGWLNEHKGINLPGVQVSIPSLTRKDVLDVNFGIRNGVDYFALSFVRSADDLKEIKSLIHKKGADIPVIAKIEKPEAVKSLDAILAAADGVMVARGDLGVEMKPEFVPTIQKQIIDSARRKNVLVITATQMLETMRTNPIPTRAEASDVANAIFDGTDAVMLSAETAIGKYPTKAVRMMSDIAAQAENSPFMRYNIQFEKDPMNLVTHAVALSAVNILREIDARCIMAFTESGGTAKKISNQRPSRPVYAFTSGRKTYHRLSLLWGITPMYIPNIKDTPRLLERSEHLLIGEKRIQKGDFIVLVVGLGLTKGSTNMIKIHRVGMLD